uniref:NFX1-type zinc finger-containing protein 1 n=1 Tax=Panagrolaimus davidi TaxID=227884 RepID=A0A914PRP9_9BILA
MQENPVCARIANYIVKLLLLGYQLLPSTMDQHLSDVVSVISSLKAVKDECLKEETKNELERLEIALKARQEVKNAQRLTEDKRKQENKEFVGSVGEPPKNFREISVVPIPEDIKHEISPYLRPAKVKGRYQSDEQYLDILFRLLREDLIRPLRDGIAAYRKGGTKETDLYVYRDVEIGKSCMHKKTGELLSTASINVLKRMRWDKRLKYGSLVCLSSDDFQESFLFATVLERDDLPNGKVGLKFEDVLKINTKLKYKMVESPAFFEAYRHVMTALQAIEEDEPIPFTNYLVDVETTTKPPLYSIDKRFDFKSLFKVDRQNTEFFLHEIRRLKPDDFGMDESQFNALLYTLTSELAIIQGPPGTGKTFMGLQIVKLLFDNWSIWNSDERDCRPLLVVCYTNHALDQFLEGISEFIEDGIVRDVRVGGRCKNDKVAQYNLSRARRWDNPTIRNQFYNKKEEIDLARKELQEASTTLKAVESRFASPLQLSRTFWDEEKRCNKNNFFGFVIGDISMFKWLTQTDQIYQMTIYDINIIRQLMEWDIPEIKAKNILADAYERHYLPDAESLYYFLQGPGGDYYSDSEVSANAKLWPKIDDIDQVKLLGYSDNVAAELLVGMSVDEIREEHDRSNGTKTTTSQQLSNVTAILEQLDTSEQPPEADNKDEEVDELAFKDDDEENRKIIDTDVMEDFQERKDESEEVKGVDWFNAEILKDFLEHITSAEPMTEEECDETEDIWALPLQIRWKLYQFWIKKCHEEVKERIKKLEEEYSEKMKLLVDFRSLADVDVLKSAKVVGMTTTGAAKLQSTLRALRPKIVIVEEAAEVLEAHSLTSLTPACQHLILIGDHKQLRPSAAVYELARKYHMEVSLFERLINNGYPYKMLKNQHRMCPDISRVLMPHFYQDLKDDPSVFEKESVKGVTKNLLFINHSYPELTEKEFKSHKNLFEAEYAIQLARYFLQQNYKAEQITILCTYLDQLLELRKKANEKFGKEHGLVIQSVDNYQGEENDIVILSLVRSNNPENKIGFLKIPNRVCVALSRAKLGLYVICNMDFFAKNCELWNEIRNSAVKAGALKNELIVRCQKHQNEQVFEIFF